MSRKTLLKFAILFFPILAATAGFRLFAQAEGGYTVYLPLFARSSSCDVPSANHPTIQSAIDDGCYLINLTAALYIENILIQDHSVIIRGQGPANTTIDGNAAESVFRVDDKSTLTLENVTVRNGYTESTFPSFGGGGIRNQGVTHLFNTVVKENSALYFGGGGVYSDGILTIENSWIIDNDLPLDSSGSKGSGVFVRGTAHITNTTISGNEGYEGGGIYVGGYPYTATLTVVNSIIRDNLAQEWGGGIRAAPNAIVLISNTLISGNVGGVGGGGIGNSAIMQVIGSTIIENVGGDTPLNTAACGGGILNAGGYTATDDVGILLVDQTEIRDNVANRDGAGICNEGTYSEIEIYNSLFAGNSLVGLELGEGGGFFSASNNIAIIENSTFIDNTAGSRGGGISARYLKMVNVTVTKNNAPNSGGVNSFANIQMVNSIVAANSSGGNCGTNAGGQLISLGYNIASDDTCNLNGPSDMPNTNPLLGPLQDNGGPTFTTALLPNSPAIDTANNAACPPTDQRGVIRPQGPACDIGAYEYNG